MPSSEKLRAALGLGSLLTASCFSPIDHTGRQCPCVSGYRCDTTTSTCVPDELDAHPGSDGGTVDGGSRDAALDGAGATLLDVPALDDVGREPDAFVRTDAFAPPDAFSLDAFSLPDAGFEPCPTGIFLCDDFESAVASRVPPWGYSVGMPARSIDRAYRGSASGRFAIVSAGETQSVGRTVPMPGEMWVRTRLFERPRMGMAQRSVAFLHFGDDTAPIYHNVSLLIVDEPGGLTVAV
jgi:hypothetical protein